MHSAVMQEDGFFCFLCQNDVCNTGLLMNRIATINPILKLWVGIKRRKFRNKTCIWIVSCLLQGLVQLYL